MKYVFMGSIIFTSVFFSMHVLGLVSFPVAICFAPLLAIPAYACYAIARAILKPIFRAIGFGRVKS